MDAIQKGQYMVSRYYRNRRLGVVCHTASESKKFYSGVYLIEDYWKSWKGGFPTAPSPIGTSAVPTPSTA